MRIRDLSQSVLNLRLKVHDLQEGPASLSSACLQSTHISLTLLLGAAQWEAIFLFVQVFFLMGWVLWAIWSSSLPLFVPMVG